MGHLVVTVWQHFLGTGKAFKTLTLDWRKSEMVGPDTFGVFMLFAWNITIQPEQARWARSLLTWVYGTGVGRV